jgi:hypothetical protein
MYVDYFDSNSALAAVRALHGTRDPGTSHLKLNVSLTKSTADAIDALRRLAPVEEKSTPSIPLPKSNSGNQNGAGPIPFPKSFGAIKCLRSRDSGKEICVIDFSLLS